MYLCRFDINDSESLKAADHVMTDFETEQYCWGAAKMSLLEDVVTEEETEVVIEEETEAVRRGCNCIN